MGPSETAGFWNDIAEGYSSREQGGIPHRVIGDLVADGVIGGGSRVLEIGSGPGTYSVPIARSAAYLECVDSSERMLERLRSRMDSDGLRNAGYVCSMWGDYPIPERPFDVCISSLCPFSGTPESVSRMEACSGSWCVLVSWEVNHGDDLTEAVWRELGFDYDFSGRSSTAIVDRLTGAGRDPMVRRYEETVEYSARVEDLVRRETEVFRAYGADADRVGDIVRCLYPGDEAHFVHRNIMRVVRWRPDEKNGRRAETRRPRKGRDH